VAGWRASGSFDCAAHDEAVSSFAQDDGVRWGRKRTGNCNCNHKSNGKGKVLGRGILYIPTLRDETAKDGAPESAG
jgi:hypothetical protein